MFEIIKTKIWEMLKTKEVSLAMVFNREGQILWHKGRKIIGRTIEDGAGFSKSYLRMCLNNGQGLDKENVVVTSSGNYLSESAFRLVLKCVLIHPIENELFLYIDSGKKEAFSPSERDMIKMLGDMLAEAVKQVKKNQDIPGGITSSSPAMDKIKNLVLNYSIVDEPVLLKGETGVGKNYIAEQIHRNSGRKGRFVVVHTPGFNENLFESEIFGHKKGAFTDAAFDKTGLVAEAEGGTLFFDEISEIPLSFQTKLLRFIETKQYRIVGESTEQKADVRIITATNRGLLEAIQDGKFREDLYFRLHVLEIDIPPLRKRKEDIRSLLMANSHYLNGKQPGDGFWEVLMNYDWPGNVRELITVIKRAGIMLESPVTGQGLDSVIQQGIYKKPFDTEETAGRIDQVWEEIKAGKSFWESLWSRFIGREIDRYFVKQILKKAYMMQSNNFKKMTRLLNIPENDYQKFMSLMYKYKIDPRN